MAKQPTKLEAGSDTIAKKPAVKKGQFDLKAFKKDIKLEPIKDKDLEWFTLSPAFQEITRLPGIPKGYYSLVYGYSNTGKSTMKLELIKSCQKNGVLPVIIETENHFSWEHAKSIGVEFEESYGESPNTETGELENKVVGYDGFFLYYDTNTLFDLYGKWDYKNGKELSKPNRDCACVEDVAKCIDDLLNKQRDGELPVELCFIWDSIGSLPCYADLVSDTGNNMFAAASISKSMAIILNDKIPSSRSVKKEYTNTIFTVNKVWKNSQGHGQPVLEMKGGVTMKYAPRITIQLGGIETAGIKKLKAVKNGKDYQYGIETKIRVDKNQVTDILYEGTICSTPHGFVHPQKLEAYKKEQIQYLLKKLDSGEGDASDIQFQASDAD
jgi:hypothetical protein